MALTKVTGQVIKNTTDVTVGVLTVTNTLAVGGTVSIGGTLTYEDVTNVDSVGLITARNGIVVGSGITLSKDGDVFATGIVTATTFSGTFSGDGTSVTGVAATENIRTNTNATFLQNINVSGLTTTGIISAFTNTDGTTDLLTLHADADGTNNGVASIKFTGNTGNHSAYIKGGHTTNGDTILTFHTDDYASGFNPEERLRIKSDGNVEIGSGTHSRRLSVHDTTNSVILIEGASNGTSNLMFGDENDEDVGMLGYNHGSNYLAFTVNAAERLRITSSGNIDINGTPPWSVSGGDYRSLSISGEGVGASGFIYLGNGGATTNADFDLGRINFCNGSTIVARVLATTDSSDNDEGRVSIYTKKTGISESEKLRIDSDGHVNVKLGNLVIGTSGKGIDFSATANSDQTGSSMSSELLDDYEEGSWTPGNSDMGITNHYAYYTKVGRMVHIVMDITFASSPADSSQVGYVTQLPFDAGNFAQHVTVQWFGTSSVNDNNYYNTWMQTYIASGDDKLSILDARYGSYVTRATLAGKKLRANFWYVSS
jgi:hypothetical protein